MEFCMIWRNGLELEIMADENLSLFWWSKAVSLDSISFSPPSKGAVISKTDSNELFFLYLYKILLSTGLLLMDELSKALYQFYPASGEMNLGSSGQPPLPSDPFIPVSQDPEDNPPEGSQPLVHQQQDQTSAPQVTAVGQQKLESVLLKHIKRHCQLVEVQNKYPQLNSTEVDSLYLAKNMAISQFDTDTKSDSEMADLAASIGNYKKR